MTIRWEVLVGAVIIASSILYIGRWEITAAGYGFSGGSSTSDTTDETVFRLDRWSGEIDSCISLRDPESMKGLARTGRATMSCQLPQAVLDRALGKPSQ